MGTRPVGNNGGVKQFPATTAFPGFEGTDKVEVYFSVHTAFTFRTTHIIPPLWLYSFHNACLAATST